MTQRLRNEEYLLLEKYFLRPATDPEKQEALRQECERMVENLRARRKRAKYDNSI